MAQPPYGYGAPPGQPPMPYAGPPAGAGYPQPGAPPGFPPAGGVPPEKSFFGSLFDLSFSSFVTTKIVKLLYGLWLLAAALILLGSIGGGILALVNVGVQGLVMLVAGPLATLLWLVLGRVYFELVIVMFRIAENIGEMNRKTKG